MKKIFLVILIVCVLAVGCREKADDNIEIVMIDGIKHIHNPAEPINGTIVLELEKKLEINPYDHEVVGINYYFSIKDKDGEVILYDPNEAEVHKFSSTGEYLGSLIRHGEGPGEFSPMRGLFVHLVSDQIWVTGGRKLAKFYRTGQFIEEFKIDDTSLQFFDESNYIATIQNRDQNTVTQKIALKKITKQNVIEEGPSFIEARNVGMIRVGNRAFGDDWGVPDLEFAADPQNNKVYVVLTSEYKITVKDIDGNTLYVIQRPYENIKVSRADIVKMMPWVEERERSRWILDAYPDHLVAITEMAILPSGFLAVYRVSGPREAEIDIYDPDGRYVYIMKLPEGMELRHAVFYDFGFSTQETRDDMPVYVEYRVKNLPEIFAEN
jgi:hypothetical protein